VVGAGKAMGRALVIALTIQNLDDVDVPVYKR
jgi:hypothetical protein